jgi:hypothetical protein
MIRRIPNFDQTLNRNNLVEKLLAKNHKNALTLAAILMIEGMRINQSTQDKLYDQLLNKYNDIAVFSRIRGNKILERFTVQDCNTPHSCDYRYNSFNTENDLMILYFALFKLTPKIKEFSVWHCQDVINENAKSVFSLDALCRRFLSLSNPNNPGFVLEYKSLCEALMVFIAN